MVDIGTVVNVRTSIATAGLPNRAFGRGLLLTTEATLSGAGPGKVITLASAAEAVTALPAGSAALAAAEVWFAADPRPEALYVGRWNTAAVDTSLSGTPTVAADAVPLNSSTASFSLNGVDVMANLSGTAGDTYIKIAALIQAAIMTIGTPLAGVTLTYSSPTGFVLDLGGQDPITGGGLGDTTGTPIAAALGLAPDSPGVVYVQGAGIESLAQAAQECIDLTIGTGEPVGIILATDAPATEPVTTVDSRLALAAWAEGTDYACGVRETAQGTLVANETASVAAQIIGLSRGRTSVLYTDSGPLPDVALIAEMSAQDLESPNSIITPHAKPLPGVLSTQVTRSQLAELKRKRVSVYTTVGNVDALLGGYTSRGGYWLDAIWWLAWLKSRVETGVFGTQRASRRFSRVLLADALLDAMQAGVVNGGIEPGRSVSASTRADIIQLTGNHRFDGRLETGYIIWIDDAPNQQDLDNRIARFQIFVVGSPAVHETFGDIRFQN